MAKDVLLKILMDKPVSYHADFAKVLGSVTAGLFLSQAIYWTGKGFMEDGWFYKSREEWKNELGMSRKEQETARKKLRNEGVLEEHLRSLPARIYYRVNFDRLIEIMRIYYDAPETTGKSSWTKSDQLDGTTMTSRKARKSLPYNTENTTEITTSVVVATPTSENISSNETASSSVDDSAAFDLPLAGQELQMNREEKTPGKLPVPAWEKIRANVRAVAGTPISAEFAKEVEKNYPQDKVDSVLEELRCQLARGIKIKGVGAWLRYALANDIKPDQSATTTVKRDNKKGFIETSYPHTADEIRKKTEYYRSLGYSE